MDISSNVVQIYPSLNEYVGNYTFTMTVSDDKGSLIEVVYDIEVIDKLL